MKTLLSFIFALSLFNNLQAKNQNFKPDCDVCSTSTSTNNLSFNLNNLNHIGLSFFYQNYNSKNGIFNNSPEFKEHYRTILLSGNYNISKKWNLNYALPFQMHNRALKDRTIDQFESGIGDINIQSFYTLYKADSLDNNDITLRFGGGGKIPIAKYKADQGVTTNPNFNLGSGAWDFNLAFQFNWVFKSKGFTSKLNYTWKTENSKDFKFGNQVDLSVLYFQNIKISNKIPLTLISGLRNEWYASNEQTGFLVEESKGYVHFAQFGLDVPLKTFTLGSMIYIPLKQELMKNRLKVNSRASVYLKWNF